MVELLTSFVVDNKFLVLPGLGRLEVVENPARLDGGRELMLPPFFSFQWFPEEAGAPSSAQGLMGFLSRKKQLSEEESFDHLQIFCSEIQIQIQKQGEWGIPGLGKFFRMAGGRISFVPDSGLEKYYEPLPSPKARRSVPVHTLLVGDKETNSLDMQHELLDEEEEVIPGNRWWIPALIIGSVTLALIYLRLLKMI